MELKPGMAKGVASALIVSAILVLSNGPIALPTWGAQSKAGVRELRETVRKNPNNPEARLKLGVALAREGEFERAIAEFREAIRTLPSYPISAEPR